MKVKDFLSRAIRLDELINSHTAELNHYRALAERLGGGRERGERVTHSAKNEAPYARWVERIADKETEINAEIDRLLSVKLEISAFIDKVKNPKWQCLLRSRYVMCLTWADVAEEMGCGLSSVYRIHNEILKNLENESV